MRRPDADAVFRLLADERADPRPAQIALLVPVLLDLGFRFGSGWPDPFGWAARVGWALVALATVAAALVGIRRLPAGLVVALPVLDIAAFGLLRLTVGSPIALALVFPAVWLALQFRARGVVVGLVATAVTMLLPGLWVAGISVDSTSKAAQVLLSVGLCAVLVAAASQTWRAQREGLLSARADAERVADELRQQRRLQEAVVTSVDVGLVALDADGCYSTMNPRHQQFMALAYPDGHAGQAGQLGAVYSADGITDLDDPEAMPSWRAAHGEEFEDLLIWVGPDPRTRRALAVSARSVRDDDGQFAGAVLAYHDVTDLIHALRTKDEFVATVSHELRTPLTSILGYLDVVRADVEGVPAQAHEYLDAAARNAERLLQLVSDLLQVGQHDAGIRPGREVLDLADTVVECVDTARQRARESSLMLECEVAGPAIVSGDAGRLRQLMDNLLSNAVKYSPAGGTVGVRLGVADGHAEVVVRDTGIGIAADELGQLFARFYRAREANRLAIQGAGLGLAICKDIVDAHGGTISVSSEVGVGTEFVVRLPVASALEAVS